MITFKQSLSEEKFKEKYMINGEETFDEVFIGIAEEIASVESTKAKKKLWEGIFFDQMTSGKLIPAGRILANARPNARMPYYNNCYTIAIEDSIEGIGKSQAEDLTISATGGGVGINFSNIRPKDTPTSKGGESSGPLSFMGGFDYYAHVIHTGGSRRSAHIAILNVDHPDIEAFITCKRGDENGAMTQFNISVGVTDEFMRAVDSDLPWDLIFDGKVYKTVQAKELYELMTKNAFTHNEPGILNLDIINKFNNGYYGFNIFEVNPCGEIVMPPYSLCCLSALNLTKFVINPFTPEARFDWTAYKETIAVGIRFLDNVLDATKYPLQKIEDMSKQWRRIGLGFTGLADAWAMLGIVYGSKESKLHSHVLGQNLRDASYDASIELAREKGPFPACDKPKLAEANFIKLLPETMQTRIRKYGLRNIAMNTTAPTGTTSLTLGQNCSSGIEPIFSLSYDRNVRTGRSDETKKERIFDYAWGEYLGQLESKPEEPNTVEPPKSFVTTFDIDVYSAIDIQAIFQIYIDHSISKTLNLPLGTTYEEYNKLFRYAYKKGLKGFTSFNPEGSMKGILEAPKAESTEEELQRTEEGVIIRPKKVPCDIHEVKFNKKNYLVLVGLLDGKPYEVFVTLNENKKDYPMNGKKSGIIQKVKKGKYNLVIPNGEDKVYIEDITNKFDKVYLTMGRFISMALRSNHPLQFVVEQLLKDGNFAGFEKTVGRVLKKYIKEGEKVKSNTVCPECGNTELRYQEGCLSCSDCGWSLCG